MSYDLTSLPRMLLIDMTPLGGVSATGALKEAYFSDWPADKLIQLHEDRPGGLSLIKPLLSANATAISVDDIDIHCAQFDPEIILYRPVADRPALHECAMEIMADLGVPHVIWMMDDWADRLRTSDPERCESIERDLRLLMGSAARNYAISEKMAEAFAKRYSVEFQVARNGVLETEWQRSAKSRERDNIIIRYAGSLAPDTTKDSVIKAASVVSSLEGEASSVQLEIRTQPHWFIQFGSQFDQFKNVKIAESNAAPEEYRSWLMGADIVLVTYNFDEKTRRYLKYSFANKVPEALASGAAVLVFGPDDIETVEFLKKSESAACVTIDVADALSQKILELAKDADVRKSLAEKSRYLAFTEFSLDEAKKKFFDDLTDAAKMKATGLWRSTKTHIDESLFIHSILNAENESGVMIDVGAHLGSSLRPFAEAGWCVFAFEPDPANRRALIASDAHRTNVLIFNQAIGASAQKGVSLYTSPISSGISGLHPFHKSHHNTAKVDVTTLNRVIAQEKIIKIDFLKIDVEGHEMSVLDGINLKHHAPRAIVAEFDEAKTRSLGFDVYDLADRFVAAGYQVLVSEWEPITTYGGDHQWRRLRPYPCLLSKHAWGNLIALKEPTSNDAIEKALEISVPETDSALKKKPWLLKSMEYLMTHHPVFAELLRFAKWTPNALLGSMAGTSIFLTLLTIMTVVGVLWEPSWTPWWIILWLCAAGASLVYLLIAYGLERVSRFEITRLDALNGLQNELKRQNYE